MIVKFTRWHFYSIEIISWFIRLAPFSRSAYRDSTFLKKRKILKQTYNKLTGFLHITRVIYFVLLCDSFYIQYHVRTIYHKP